MLRPRVDDQCVRGQRAITKGLKGQDHLDANLAIPSTIASPVRASTPSGERRAIALHNARISDAASASTPDAPRRHACGAARVRVHQPPLAPGGCPRI
eukprot:16451582-Heterocapsa_arctica.AAC.1